MGVEGKEFLWVSAATGIEGKVAWGRGWLWWPTAGFPPARTVQLAGRCRKKCRWLFASGDVRTVDSLGEAGSQLRTCVSRIE